MPAKRAAIAKGKEQTNGRGRDAAVQMSMMVPWRKTMGSAKLLVGKHQTPRREPADRDGAKWNREHAQASAPAKADHHPRQGQHPDPAPHQPSDIIQRVAFWHDVTAQEILSDSRLIPIVEARFDAIAAVRINCRIAGRRPGLMDLARQFKRDHTSIISALRQRGLRWPAAAYSSLQHGPLRGYR